MRFTHGLVFVGGGRHGPASAHDLASIRDHEKTTATIATRMCTSQQETSSLLKHLTDARYLRTARHPRIGVCASTRFARDSLMSGSR